MRAVVLASSLAALAAAGCELKVVELRPPSGDAGPTIKCEVVTRADGTRCRLCFSESGEVVRSECPRPPPPVDPGPGTSGGAPVCKVAPLADGSRCLVCAGTAGESSTVCLKCEPPATIDPNGGYCRSCGWSDGAPRACVQCFGAAGAVTYDDCDKLRKEAIPSPDPATADAGR
jgi:hypothetical protein